MSRPDRRQFITGAAALAAYGALARGVGGFSGRLFNIGRRDEAKKYTVADYYNQHRYTVLDAIEFSGPEEHGTIGKNWYDHANGGYADFFGYANATLSDCYLEGALGSCGRYRQDVSSYEMTDGFTVECVACALSKYTSGTWNYSLDTIKVFSTSTQICDVNLRGDDSRIGLIVGGHAGGSVHSDGVLVDSIPNYYSSLHSYSAVCTPTSIKFYIDGVLRTDLTGSYTMPSFTNKLYEYIGIGNSNVVNRTGCYRIYDAPLTEAQVLANYAVDKERFGL